ncbi:MAG: DUF1735 domain-containing protein [Bacteroidales bacterium]|jgi:hypothetical protein|nr:DUF1735 domain-containing protein [Bacteroidales bacterium]
MMNRKYFFNIAFRIAVPCCVALMVSCTDDGIPENLEFEQFKYLYFPSANTVNKITFVRERDSVFHWEGLCYGGTTNFNQGEIRAEIGVDPSLVTSYNTANNTAFLPLPAGCYELSGASQVIENGKNYSEGGSLTIKNVAVLDTDREYLLPVTILSVGESNIPTNDERKTLWWSVNTEPYWPVPDKTLWSVIDYSSQWQSTTSAANVIDGTAGEFWHSDASGSMPQWVVIDLSATATINGVRFTNRQSSDPNDTSASPRNVKFEVSDNQTDWTLLLNVPELPNVQAEQTLDAPAPQSGRYLKITIVNNWAGAGYSYIAEVDFF